MNLGLSDILKSKFNNFTPVKIPLVLTYKIPDPNWVAGFVTGEGNFDVMIHKSKTHKIGHQVQLRFRITQHERDKKLMEHLIKYLGSGKIEKDPRNPVVSLIIVKFSDINKIIIPFFEQNPLLGIKQFDYLDWCKIAKLMNEGSHLTIEGLDLIRTIKSGMNKGRKLTNI
jgi:LAGLIDADG endonuclease